MVNREAVKRKLKAVGMRQRTVAQLWGCAPCSVSLFLSGNFVSADKEEKAAKLEKDLDKELVKLHKRLTRRAGGNGGRV